MRPAVFNDHPSSRFPDPLEQRPVVPRSAIHLDSDGLHSTYLDPGTRPRNSSQPARQHHHQEGDQDDRNLLERACRSFLAGGRALDR